MASIARAFSTRPRTASEEKSFSRNSKLSKSKSMRAVSTMQISAPVLLSTTNVQSLNTREVKQPSLRKVSSVLSHSSVTSDGHSDHSSIGGRSRGASFTDNSSVGSSPSSPKPAGGESPQSHWGTASNQVPRKAKSSIDLKGRFRTFASEPAPPIPARTHSQNRLNNFPRGPLSRKESFQAASQAALAQPKPQPREIPKSVPAESVPSILASPDILRSHQLGSPHPFSKEMRQVDEIAADLRDAARQEDFDVMRNRDLRRFCADDYIRDLQPLFSHYFMPQQATVGWI